MDTSVRERFARLAALPDDERIDLATGALLIAAEGRPEVDPAHYLARIDAIAEQARAALAGAGSDVERVARLNELLFERLRFTGNRYQYDDVRNSFLDQVIERRTGIPITLSVLYMEVARRSGVPIEGVGFPGHFLVKLAGPRELIVDCFHGEVIGEEECAERLRQVYGADARFDRRYLAPAGWREILARMLRNLKTIHAAQRDWMQALACSDRILLLLPDDPAELRDRGLFWEQLECFAAARADLERFVALAGAGPAVEAVRENLERVRQAALRIH
jgi:regulator of sirC expression with transglutaminase-like and TPR domain